jgi:rSAM/selenodomain-associated transferase 2/rSAM/selenodomain-associated transferase 1
MPNPQSAIRNSSTASPIPNPQSAIRNSMRLILFTRYPEPGRAKTRLISALGEEGAAELHHWMTVRTLAQARRFLAQKAVSSEVRFDGGTQTLMREWLGPDLAYQPQGEGDLGRRMARAFEEAFTAGIQEVVIVGTDCPGLTARDMEVAFNEVQCKDLVLGPAADGGYYLIGLGREIASEAIPQLFSGIAWGTGEVLSKTMKVAEGLGLSVALLEPLADVDRPEDLSLWEEKEAGIFPPGRISIVIPTLNEAGSIEATLREAERGCNLEIIVADGQSQDETQEKARARGAIVLTTRTGRASQMNAGAALATGDILLFLHADTRLPPGFDGHIRQALAQPSTVGGAFELSIDAPSPSLRRIERLANWRSRRLHLPYGDQAIFMRADVFWGLSGFPDMAIMEDFEMVRKLGQRGKIAIVPEPVVTSGRRWLVLGVGRTTLINQMVIAAYLLGVSPSRIARWYRRKGRDSSQA